MKSDAGTQEAGDQSDGMAQLAEGVQMVGQSSERWLQES